MRTILSVSASLLAIIAMTAPTTHASSISFAAMSESNPAGAPVLRGSQSAIEFDSFETNGTTQEVVVTPAAPAFHGLPVQPSMNLTPVGIMVASSSVSVVPEPGTWVLMGLGALGLLAARKRFRAS